MFYRGGTVKRQDIFGWFGCDGCYCDCGWFCECDRVWKEAEGIVFVFCCLVIFEKWRARSK
jgi:hypothetical protein